MCQCCGREWVAEMGQNDLRIKLCVKHTEELLHARNDKSGKLVEKFITEKVHGRSKSKASG